MDQQTINLLRDILAELKKVNKNLDGVQSQVAYLSDVTENK